MRSIMTYVLWRGVVWWRCMELLMITVHKHVYTTTPLLFYRYQPMKTRPPKSLDKQSWSATPPRKCHTTFFLRSNWPQCVKSTAKFGGLATIWGPDKFAPGLATISRACAPSSRRPQRGNATGRGRHDWHAARIAPAKDLHRTGGTHRATPRRLTGSTDRAEPA